MAMMSRRQGVQGPQQYKYTQEARNSLPTQARALPGIMKASTQQGSVVVPGQEPLTTAMLAAAPMQEQKQMLGSASSPSSSASTATWPGKSLECCWRLTTRNCSTCWRTLPVFRLRWTKLSPYSRLTKSRMRHPRNKSRRGEQSRSLSFKTFYLVNTVYI